MKSFLLRALGALAVLVLPAIGSASYHYVTWPLESYQGLSGGTAVIPDTDIDIGFPFTFYGETYTTFRAGPNGYITFGGSSATQSTPSPLDGAAGPGNVIAAWWGDHFCRDTDVMHKVDGDEKDLTRTHTIEWRCEKRGTGTGDQAEVGFTAKIVLFENSSVIQLHYQKLREPESTDWSAIRVGVKNHDGTQFVRPLDCPLAGCRKVNFPEMSAVQIGVWEGNVADLIARIETADHGIELETPSGPQAWVSLEGELENISEIGQDGVWHQVYLAPEKRSFSLQDAQVSTGLPADIGGLGKIPVELNKQVFCGGSPDGCENNLPRFGTYHICLQAFIQAARTEIDPTNNWDCKDEPIVFGPDLVPAVDTDVSQALPMEPFTVKVSFKNEGNFPAYASPSHPIRYRLNFIDVDGVSAPGHAVTGPLLRANAKRWNRQPDVFRGEIKQHLGPGQEFSEEVLVKIPFTSNNQKVNFRVEVIVDSSWAYELDGHTTLYTDAVPTNNQAYSDSEYELLVPTYGVGEFDVWMPFQCTMQEPLWAEFEICNESPTTEAHSFVPEIAYPTLTGGASSVTAGLAGRILNSCFRVINHGSELAPDWDEIDDPTLCAPDETCSRGMCWKQCDSESSIPNNGCDPGFACKLNYYILDSHLEEVETCVPYLEPNSCHTYELHAPIPHQERDIDPTGRLPFRQFADGRASRVVVVPNPLSSPATNSIDADWEFAEGEFEITCNYGRPDPAAEGLPTTPLEVTAGEPFEVERLFRNHGTQEVAFEYGYYMAPIPAVSPNQWPVAIVGSADKLGRTALDRAKLNEQRFPVPAMEQRYDMIRVDADTPPGEYYFAVIIDPFNKVEEITKTNNRYTYHRKLVVKEASLKIETGMLPNGTVGQMYNTSLWASGGTGNYTWEKGEGFPGWMDLDPSTGHLSGIPTEARSYNFTVKVRSGGLEASKIFYIEVDAPEAGLFIPHHVLPLAVATNTYGPVQLTANGGLPPYTWSIISIDDNPALPAGMCFHPSGVIDSATGCIEGAELMALPGHLSSFSRPFIVVVRDARGAEATNELRLHLAGDTELYVDTRNLSHGIVGNAYESCLKARGGSGHGYTWEVNSLPLGLTYRQDADDVCIEGTPLEWGLFQVDVVVSDPSGLEAGRTFALSIENASLELSRGHIGDFERGGHVDERIYVVGLSGEEAATMKIIMGRLPSGIELSSDGWIRGVVGQTAAYGIYPITVEVRSESGRLGTAALSIRVIEKSGEKQQTGDDDDKDKGCGASATGNDPAAALPFGVAALGLWALVRKNRRVEEGAI